MEEKEELNKQYLNSFSQEGRIRTLQRDKHILNHFKTNIKKIHNSNYKSNFNRINYVNINDNINDSNRPNFKDSMTKNLFLKSQKIEKPIIIKKSQNNVNKLLPALKDKKKNYFDDS